MKITTTKISKNKIYLFSLSLFICSSIFCSIPAYSQIDYNYGLSKKGFRLSLGTGATILQSNWSQNPLNYAAIGKLDYDFTQYFSIGIEGQYGILVGMDQDKKLYYNKTTDTYINGNLNFRVAIGAISDFEASNGLQDMLKSFYLGTGIGSMYSSVKLLPHYDGTGLTSIGSGKTITASAQYTYKGTGNFIYVPINFGTNIALPGVLGNDRLVINPNYQYNYVLSPVFDGYQPNSNTDNGRPISGNGAFSIISLSLKYKF